MFERISSSAGEVHPGSDRVDCGADPFESLKTMFVDMVMPPAITVRDGPDEICDELAARRLGPAARCRSPCGPS